jgi:hypothetical protein
MDLRGVDIGPPPDFWKDYGDVTRRIKAPTRSAASQGEALAPARQERRPLTVTEQQVAGLPGREAILRAQAAESGPPLRMVSGPGIIPGYMPDTTRMNAYQRDLYLPQSSSMMDPRAEQQATSERTQRGMAEWQSYLDQLYR